MTLEGGREGGRRLNSWLKEKIEEEKEKSLFVNWIFVKPSVVGMVFLEWK